jgi:UDPglucose 6-dehydrogenase
VNITVVGAGYVGLVTGTCFSDFGVHVTCVDNDADKVARLKAGECPIFEPGLEALLKRNVAAERLAFTTDLAKAVHGALIIFIAVGTPPKDDGEADLSSVGEVASQIGRTMNGYKVIVTKSTVPVGTGRWVRETIAEQSGGRFPFDVVSNPEFLREGSAIEDFMRPNRVVLGAESDQAVAIMRDLYRPLYLIETPFIVTTVETAEMIKYASNAFLAVKISYINEVANLCERVGADVHVVAKGMGLDQRIGGKFLHPGPGYGGSCFPKDTEALVHLARKHDTDLRVVSAAIDANEQQRLRMVDKVRTMLGGDVSGKLLAFAGLAFKPNTDDMRDAPAVTIIRELQKGGARIRAYDPAARSSAEALLPGITYAEDIYDAAKGAEALVIMTEWNQFRGANLKELYRVMAEPRIVDLRNIFDPETVRAAGFTYVGVGR